MDRNCNAGRSTQNGLELESRYRLTESLTARSQSSEHPSAPLYWRLTLLIATKGGNCDMAKVSTNTGHTLCMISPAVIGSNFAKEPETFLENSP